MYARLTIPTRCLLALALAITSALPSLAQYGGADPNAPWRAQAEVMIDQNRKADLTIRLFDQSGGAVQGAQVHVLQTEQAYQFGSAVAVEQILGTTGNDAIYRQKFEELFNTATIENSLKWVPLTGAWGPNFSLDRAIQTLDYLNARGIRNRGHTLVWPGWSNLPSYLQGLAGNPTALRQEIYDHIDEIAGAVDGKVVEWDVVNEPRTNNDLMGVFGDSILTDIFNRTEAATSGPMFINEFNIITQDGNFFTRLQYLNTINYLLSNGANLGGIGMQGHFNANSLTSMENVWSILDQFGATGLPITITEYDLNTTNETLKADYLRDFLTAVFAHPDTNGFIMWGFWEGRHWRPDAAMFNLDWSETPSVQVWRDLVLNAFMTDETLTSDDVGETHLRAFHGDYTIEVTVDGQTYYDTVTLTPDGEILDITLPITGSLVGDLDDDGFVGIGDLNIILGNWNANVAAGELSAGDPSGNGFVGIEDLNTVLGNWNAGNPPAQAAPEPGSLALLGGAGVAMFRRQR
jgi:GH35 family endo-1,4-beta-xylanase